MMSDRTAVLDSCVLFPNILRDTLLTAYDVGLYRAYWSQSILDGVTKNLVKRQIVSDRQAKYLENTIKSYFPEATIAVPAKFIAKMTNHPGDRHVLATAVEAKAKIIVTFNLKHFKSEDTASWGVRAQHPDLFLSSLLEFDSDLVFQAIDEQIARYSNPPLSDRQLFAILAKDVPKFVNELSKYSARF